MSAISENLLLYNQNCIDTVFVANLTQAERTNDGISFIISLLPSLESVEVAVMQYDFPPSRVFHFSAPRSLPSLRNAEFLWQDEDGFTLNELKPFLKAAPNLQRLEIHAIMDNIVIENSRERIVLPELDVVMTQLKEIDIRHSAVSINSIEALLKASPNLEVLKYVSGGIQTGQWQFHPVEMWNAIKLYGKALKRVEADFDFAVECSDYKYWDQDERQEDDVQRIEEEARSRGIALKLLNCSPA